MVEPRIYGSIRCVSFRQTGGRFSVIVTVETIEEGGDVVVEKRFGGRGIVSSGQ